MIILSQLKCYGFYHHHIIRGFYCLPIFSPFIHALFIIIVVLIAIEVEERAIISIKSLVFFIVICLGIFQGPSVNF